MRVKKASDGAGRVHYELLDDGDRPIPEAEGFLRHLKARNCSPNTVSAYAHDLKHFFCFLEREGIRCEAFSAPDSLRFLEYLRAVPSRRRVQRLSPTLVSVDADGESARRLSPATVNRALATVSSFYEYLVLAGRLGTARIRSARGRTRPTPGSRSAIARSWARPAARDLSADRWA